MSVSEIILTILAIAIVANLIYILRGFWMRRRNDHGRLPAVDFQGGQIEGDYERRSNQPAAPGETDTGFAGGGDGGSFGGGGGDGGGGAG